MASPGSAGTPAGKRVVKQEELRRLMKEKQRQSSSRRRIESPFAKYNRLGQLSCALCNTPVKSELLWQTHALGKQHREKVAELKGAKGAAVSPAPPDGAKRKAPEAASPDAKRARASAAPPQQAQPGKPPGLGLLPDYDDDDDEDGDGDEGGEEGRGGDGSLQGPSAEATGGALPHDPPKAPLIPHSGSIEKAEIHERVVERRENTAEALPEGFFDDPEVDAKVRKVDAPKDQMDKEWDEFQKAMRQVNTISEAIVAEEDEEGRLDRQIGEIDEQIECYRRVEKLRNRQDEIKNKLREVLTIKELQKKEEENADSDDEGELQDLLSQDWRVKGALL